MEISVRHGPIATIITHMVNSSMFTVNMLSMQTASVYPTGFLTSNGNLRMNILSNDSIASISFGLPHWQRQFKCVSAQICREIIDKAANKRQKIDYNWRHLHQHNPQNSCNFLHFCLSFRVNRFRHWVAEPCKMEMAMKFQTWESETHQNKLHLLWSTISSTRLTNANSWRIFQIKLIKIETAKMAVNVKYSESVNSIRLFVSYIKNPMLQTIFMPKIDNIVEFLAFNTCFWTDWCDDMPIIRKLLWSDSKIGIFQWIFSPYFRT